jgi:hypothetical protein
MTIFIGPFVYSAPIDGKVMQLYGSIMVQSNEAQLSARVLDLIKEAICRQMKDNPYTLLTPFALPKVRSSIPEKKYSYWVTYGYSAITTKKGTDIITAGIKSGVVTIKKPVSDANFTFLGRKLAKRHPSIYMLHIIGLVEISE